MMMRLISDASTESTQLILKSVVEGVHCGMNPGLDLIAGQTCRYFCTNLVSYDAGAS